jgi:competence protein ComEC
LWAAGAPLPDVLVADRAEAIAVRNAQGNLTVMRTGTADPFAVREWLAADADARTTKDETLKAGVTCDEAGCIAKLPDGRMVALALTAEAFEEDCRRAAVVVSQRTAPQACAATRIDRTVWPQSGAVAIYMTGKGLEVVAATPPGTDRPWAPALPRATEVAPSPSTTTRAPPRDATPREGELSADD